MARFELKLILICLLLVNLDNSLCNGYSKSNCRPVWVEKKTSGPKLVSHFRLNTIREVENVSVSETVTRAEIIEEKVCERNCIPKCKLNADCVKGNDGQSKCICRQGYEADSNFCTAKCDDKCGSHTYCPRPGDKCLCSPGYTRSANNKTNCEPTCLSDCGLNKHCVRPNICECIDGYEDVEGFCRPICKACKPELCVSPGICQCQPGYNIDADLICQPHCSNCAENKYCARPESCDCKHGYEENERGECKPLCEQSCRQNEECKETHKCDCLQGFKRNDMEFCVPHCPNQCQKNSYCAKPEVCLCKDGYKVDPQGICQPICQQKCAENEKCVKPNDCGCNDGYQKNTNGSCAPICSMECEENSFCVKPNECDCKLGFMGKGNHCWPKCSIVCGDNSYCARPDKCECIPGYSRIDLNSVNCSYKMAVGFIAFGSIVCTFGVVGLVSCIAIGFKRRYKKPTYSSHTNTDTVSYNLKDVNLHTDDICDTRLEGFENISYM